MGCIQQRSGCERDVRTSVVPSQRSLDTVALSFADNLQMADVAATSSLIVVVGTYHGVSLLSVSSAVGEMNMWGTWRGGYRVHRLWAFLLSVDGERVNVESKTINMNIFFKYNIE